MGIKRVLAVTGIGALGFVLGYAAGVSYACSSKGASNLCGLLGVYVTGPVGCLIFLVPALRKFDRRP
jgi:hypothetical protein